MRSGRSPVTRLTTTTFARDQTLGIDAPAEMRDLVPASRGDEFVGTARYRNFRRFQVRALEEIESPPPNPR